MAQAVSEGANVLIDDVIQALKANDTSRAQMHLSILNQQLPTIANSTSIQPVKVLLDDVTLALKNNDSNNAMVHLNLIKQQLSSPTNNSSGNRITIAAATNGTTTLSTPNINSLSIYKNSTNAGGISSPAEAVRTKIFSLHVDGRTFPIRYAITGDGSILDGIFWKNRYGDGQTIKNIDTLFVHVQSQSNGKLIMEVPRVLLDSPGIFIDGIHTNSQETTSNSKVRTLVTDLHEGLHKIEIQDTTSPKLASSPEPQPLASPQPQPPTNHQVSIVSGASDLEDKAFSPNPIEIKVGDTVTWTNNDNQIHVVTSGTGGNDPNLGKDFDSSPGLKTLLSPSQTFSHKFDTAGEFPYFCQLHPAMVGEVRVTSGEATTSSLTNDRNSVISVSPTPSEEPLPSDHHVQSKSKGGHEERGPVGGYDTGFAVGVQQANEAVDHFDNEQLKRIDADKSPPCPAVDEGNGYCKGFHDGWRKTVLDRLD